MARMLCIAAALAALFAGCGGDSEKKPAQRPSAARSSDFLGVYADDVFFGGAAYKHDALKAQHDAGIQLIRQPFAWDSFKTDPKPFDDFVGATAQAGIDLLPTALGPAPGAGPSGGSSGPMKPPADGNAYAKYLTALIDRYGPKGKFWDAHPHIPRRPIHAWQVWNEPNIGAFWGGKPDAQAYAQLLKTASAAIRDADPGAEVVTAGMPTSHLGIPAPEFAKSLDTDSFDTLAVHPYGATPAKVVENVDAIRRAVPGKKVWVTEVGWGSAGKPGPLTVTPDKQASYLRETIKRLRAEKVRGIVVFQWRDPKPFPGRREIWPYHAGLLKSDGTAKPALEAVARP